MSDLPRVIDGEELGTGGFLRLKRLRWMDDKGTERRWEMVERVKDHGAVLVFAWLRPSDRLVMIRQYRPPAGRFVYELPAGLVDAGEDGITAARRELREETGYVAAKMEIFPPAYTTPGLTSETVYMVSAEIDEAAPENRDPETEFDPSENIETLLVGRSDLADFYRRETAAGHAFDAKLAAYLLALPR